MTEEEILSIVEFEKSESFTEREKLVMRYAHELTIKSGDVDKAILRDLTTNFSPPEIVELTMVICVFNVFNRVNDVLTQDIDLDLAPLALYQKPLST